MKMSFSLGYVEFLEPNILKVVYEEDEPITFDVVLEISEIRKQLHVPVPYRLLGVYHQNMANFDESFKLFIAQNEDAASVRIADALVIRSGLKLEISHYMNHYKPVVPTKVFDTEKEAVEWLQKQ